jgi:2'-5' RNA ligase
MLYEYLTIIPPSAFVYTDIMAMKYECKADYNWHSAIKSKPHITLSNFLQPVSFDEKVISRYKRLASAASPFKIYLSGFGHFSTHTIYVKLTDSKEILDLAKNIKSFTKAVFKKVLDCPPHHMSEPHLTIAKGILEQDFHKAWPVWLKKEYNAEFDANRILLLRRPFSDIWQDYEVVGDFPLTGLGILDPQQKLF